jgi:hypothetical protein
MADLDGNATPYSWKQGPPKVDYRNQRIHVVNYRAQYDPFTIGDFTGGNVYSGEVTPYSVFPSWNHWPVAQIPSDGRYASFPDRAAHSSLTHVFLPDFRAGSGDRPFQEKLLMEGMSKLGAKELAPLARSWLQAPEIESLSDCRGQGYDPSQRAYVLCATGAAPSFRIAASAERPIVNPCFVVRNWNCEDNARLEINSAAQSGGRNFRQGIVRDPNGRPSLVVWLQHEATGPTTFTLRGARPEASAGTVKPMTWTTVPQLAADSVAVTMSAMALPGIGAQYFFECSEGPGHSSGWQSESTFTDSGLPPDAELAYRVKARDAYFAETEWSPVARIKTAAAPAPVIWNLDEGEGKTIRDSAGQHEGVIHGAATWVPGIAGKALHLDGKSYVQLNRSEELRSNGSFTWSAWIRTTQGGTILARAGAGRDWQRGGKVMFVQNGRLRFDVGWVGATGADAPVADGKWHHVAVAVSARGDGDNIQCFVNGRLSGRGRLNVAEHNEQGLPIRIGFCSDNFPPGQSGFVGDLDEVRWHPYAVKASDIEQLFLAGKPAGGNAGESVPNQNSRNP